MISLDPSLQGVSFSPRTCFLKGYEYSDSTLKPELRLGKTLTSLFCSRLLPDAFYPLSETLPAPLQSLMYFLGQTPQGQAIDRQVSLEDIPETLTLSLISTDTMGMDVIANHAIPEHTFLGIYAGDLRLIYTTETETQRYTFLNFSLPSGDISLEEAHVQFMLPLALNRNFSHLHAAEHDAILQAWRSIDTSDVIYAPYAFDILSFSPPPDGLESLSFFKFPVQVSTLKLSVDAAFSGTWTRFMNHAPPDAATVDVKTCWYKGQIVIVFFTSREIQAGEPLRYTYSSDLKESTLVDYAARLEHRLHLPFSNL